MLKRLIFIITLTWIFIGNVNCQTKINTQKNVTNHFYNKALGISFDKIGRVIKHDSTNYSIDLFSNVSSNESAVVQISAANKLFVDLPGSYGGRLYLDSPSAAKLYKNILLVDSINTGRHNFKREYWAVYAGMGMWDCVINCYTYVKGKYYIVSLVQDEMMGKPGEINNGKRISSNELKSIILSSLQDKMNTNVNKFNDLLHSIRIQNK